MVYVFDSNRPVDAAKESILARSDFRRFICCAFRKKTGVFPAERRAVEERSPPASLDRVLRR